MTFSHDGRDFLHYDSRTWIIDDNKDIIRPFEFETGYWRCRDKKVLEVVLAQSQGISEGWVGIVDGAKIQLAMDRGYSTPSANIETIASIPVLLRIKL